MGQPQQTGRFWLLAASIVRARNLRVVGRECFRFGFNLLRSARGKGDTAAVYDRLARPIIQQSRFVCGTCRRFGVRTIDIGSGGHRCPPFPRSRNGRTFRCFEITGPDRRFDPGGLAGISVGGEIRCGNEMAVSHPHDQRRYTANRNCSRRQDRTRPIGVDHEKAHLRDLPFEQ